MCQKTYNLSLLIYITISAPCHLLLYNFNNNKGKYTNFLQVGFYYSNEKTLYPDGVNLKELFNHTVYHSAVALSWLLVLHLFPFKLNFVCNLKKKKTYFMKIAHKNQFKEKLLHYIDDRILYIC